jgi:hypothetical protein
MRGRNEAINEKVAHANGCVGGFLFSMEGKLSGRLKFLKLERKLKRGFAPGKSRILKGEYNGKQNSLATQAIIALGYLNRKCDYGDDFGLVSYYGEFNGIRPNSDQRRFFKNPTTLSFTNNQYRV